MAEKRERTQKPSTDGGDLITKYRPNNLDEVYGQDHVIKSLEQVVMKRRARCFLFAGPAGTGKTTLARIVAKQYGVRPEDLVEIDGATYTGIDAMRSIQDAARYRAFGKEGMRAVLIDEVHRLSKQAFDSLLKATEEPPAHMVWLFATTEAGKVPKTIQTRCASYTLREVPENDIREVLETIARQERMNTPSDVLGLCAREARGSVRQAISYLNVAGHTTKRAEAADLIRSAEDSKTVIDLCRLLARGGKWVEAVSLISKMEERPESVRIIVCNYFAKVTLGARDDRSAQRALAVLDSFSTPYNDSEGQAPLLLSVGRLLVL